MIRMAIFIIFVVFTGCQTVVSSNLIKRIDELEKRINDLETDVELLMSSPRL